MTNTDTAHVDTWLTTREVLDLLKISRSTLYRWIGLGLVTRYRAPESTVIRFRSDEVRSLLTPAGVLISPYSRVRP